ncbi:MAG: hypothetical protein HZA22_07325 [Nitrospirae bacterium]|nr:hypothetical protein [Nitrospirota bacterium]
MDLFENIKGRMTKRVCINTPDELDILSAVWILSCNDENPIITYEGIKHRLDLSPDFKIEELIHCRGELFRRKIPTRPLEVWKQEMREGKHIPSWIADIENETERQEKIDSITGFSPTLCG